MDIEKSFDCLDDNFLISALRKYGFKNFISWVKILLRNQESYFLNGDTTTKYFLLGRGARQGDQFQLIYSFQPERSYYSYNIKTWD